MEHILRPVHVKQLNDNSFSLLEDEWMLITAGNKENYNTMTASWGAFGVLWNKPVAICFIRPQRFTFAFMNKSQSFTLSFFESKYKAELNQIGNTSGRFTNKIEKSKFTPVFTKNDTIYFQEARLVMECRKIYIHDLQPDNFIQPGLIDDIYPTGDFHRMFIGEILHCLTSE